LGSSLFCLASKSLPP